jgi:hypothetical protein
MPSGTPMRMKVANNLGSREPFGTPKTPFAPVAQVDRAWDF